MIDILRQKPFFPLKDFEDVEKLFEFNLNDNNGEPNLALLSIVAGLIEHSLVTITDKEDLIANSRPVDHRKDIAQKKFGFNQSRLTNPSSSSSTQHHNHQLHHHHHHLSSTSNDHHQQKQLHHSKDAYSQQTTTEFNEAGYVSTGDNESDSSTSPDYSANDNLPIPKIEFEIVETLYKKFVEQFKGSINFKDTELNKTNLKIKRISDSVWEHLSNSYYKDKAHLQSIFSYLTTSKLDCFGLAFAVIAGCQILNLKNIYLALSEDHAWVMFDLKQDEFKVLKEREVKEYKENNLPIPTCALHGTCEVTWHGKANSDKRGQPVTYKNCWLYTNGYAVKCDIRLCVAALVNSINPSINSNTDSEILALLQQRLLWLLYKHENYFPMSLGNLGELENICQTPNAPLNPYELFNLGVKMSRKEYNDSHVYPYSYLASFFLKHGRFKEALETWADASAVMTKYNYSRDDEEIYKEFFEVANELIPSMLKVLTAGGLEPGKVSTKPFLQDPECLALIIKFYDNICCWEEGSSTPVLHTGWAKNFVATILKFSSIIRSKIKLLTEEEWSHNKACASEQEVSSRGDQQCSSTAAATTTTTTNNNNNSTTTSTTSTISIQENSKNEKQNSLNCNIEEEVEKKKIRIEKQEDKEEEEEDDHHNDKKNDNDDNDNNNHDNQSKIGDNNVIFNSNSNVQNQKGRKRVHSFDSKVDTSESNKIFKSEQGNHSKEIIKTSSCGGDSNATAANNNENDNIVKREKRIELDSDNNVTVILKSDKIAGVRDLLQAERFQKNAIELQLTAQSQCAVRGRSNSSSYSSDFIPTLTSIGIGSTRSKRLHR